MDGGDVGQSENVGMADGRSNEEGSEGGEARLPAQTIDVTPWWAWLLLILCAIYAVYKIIQFSRRSEYRRLVDELGGEAAVLELLRIIVVIHRRHGESTSDVLRESAGLPPVDTTPEPVPARAT